MTTLKITDVYSITGMRGSGKTELAKHYIDQYIREDYPVLIFDINSEYENYKKECDVKSYNSIQEFISNYEHDLDYFIDSNPNGMIVWEDVDILISQSSIPFPILDLVVRGRHSNMGSMFLFRRPNNIHKQILYNSHHIFLPKIILPNDLKYIGQFIPNADIMLPKLNKYEFLYFHSEDSTSEIVKLNLKTDKLEVVR